MFSHGENIEEYFKAIGDVDIMHHYRNYKIHMHENGKMYRLSEYIGDLGRITNTMELDVESPFRVPGDKKGWKSIYFLNLYEHWSIHFKYRPGPTRTLIEIMATYSFGIFLDMK